MQLESLIIPLKTEMDKGLMLGAVTAFSALVGVAALAVNATMKWADELDTLQDVLGVTSKQAAALNFVLRKSGVDTDKFTKSMVFLEKGLVKADGSLDTVGKSLKDYGINVKDVSGKLKDQPALIEEISKKYDGFATQQERVNFLTEVFGRSGADLIDFFDTLSKEGGIDAVAKKVERLGLAIDPDRYEQFNRNLEELKLIGLGLAVGITEKAMPALEGFLEWITTKGVPGVKQFIDDFAKGEVDWAKISEDLIAGIDSIDWNSMGNFLHDQGIILWNRLGEAINEVDWNGLFGAIGNAFMEFATGLGGGSFAEFKAVWAANWEQAKQIGIVSMALLKAGIDSKIQEMKDAIDAKLEAIKRAFQAGFQGAMQSALNAINGMKNRLVNALEDLMAELRAAVAGGIMIAIRVSGFGGIANFISNLNLGGAVSSGGASTGGGVGSAKRASGGPVIAGQSYSVAEFFKPEVFTPNSSGRIDSRDDYMNRPVVVQFDETRLVRLLRDAFQMANAGAV